MFLKWQRPMWQGIVIGFILAVVVALVPIVFLTPSPFKYNELDSNSTEGIEARNLRMQRYEWLEDGCPQPPVASNYMQLVGGDTNYTYTGMLTVSNIPENAYLKFHGLFATKFQGSTRTLVITTSGDILAVEDSGEVRLLECMGYEGQPYKPQGK